MCRLGCILAHRKSEVVDAILLFRDTAKSMAFSYDDNQKEKVVEGMRAFAYTEELILDDQRCDSAIQRFSSPVQWEEYLGNRRRTIGFEFYHLHYFASLVNLIKDIEDRFFFERTRRRYVKRVTRSLSRSELILIGVFATTTKVHHLSNDMHRYIEKYGMLYMVKHEFTNPTIPFFQGIYSEDAFLET